MASYETRQQLSNERHELRNSCHRIVSKLALRAAVQSTVNLDVDLFEDVMVFVENVLEHLTKCEDACVHELELEREEVRHGV